MTIASDPFRLLLSQQYIHVSPPAGTTDGPSGDLELAYPSGLQVLDVNGASLTSTAGGSIDMQRGGAAVSAMLREAGANWTTGLRSVGGTGLPVIGSPLQRLADLVAYIALLWGFSRICQNLAPLRDDVQSVVLAGMNAVRAIVGAIVALAALGFGYNLMFGLLPKGTGPLLAGPVASAPGRRRRGRWRAGDARWHWARRAAARAAARGLALGVGPGPDGADRLRLPELPHRLGRHRPVTWWQAGLAVAGIVGLVYLLGRLLLRPSALRPGRGSRSWQPCSWPSSRPPRRGRCSSTAASTGAASCTRT